tara:strand:- start:707 stop:1498 length:792 start_codon:yes stop_codon:yes gene_type:complete
MLTPIDFIYVHATYVLQDEINSRQSLPDDVCSVCLRESAKWHNPYEAVDFKGYIKEVHCLACHALFHPSDKYFGIEQYRGANRVPIFNKLAMLKGCGLFVSERRTVLFANKYYEKLSLAEKFPWELVSLDKGQMTSNRILEYLGTDARFVVIGKFNRKKEELVANLRYSNKSSLYLCDDNGSNEVHIDSFKNLQNILSYKTKKEVSTWKNHVRAICLGLKPPSDKKIVKFWEANKDLQLATNSMPLNPHTRLFMAHLLGGQHN